MNDYCLHIKALDYIVLEFDSVTGLSAEQMFTGKCKKQESVYYL